MKPKRCIMCGKEIFHAREGRKYCTLTCRMEAGKRRKAIERNRIARRASKPAVEE